MLAKEWLRQARNIMDRIEETQLDPIHQAATIMADSIEAGRWVHTFGCGHALSLIHIYPIPIHLMMMIK